MLDTEVSLRNFNAHKTPNFRKKSGLLRRLLINNWNSSEIKVAVNDLLIEAKMEI